MHKPSKCPTCNKCFERKFEMKKHIESVHEGKIGCLICDSKFSNKRNLQYYDEYVTESKEEAKLQNPEPVIIIQKGNKSYKCDICSSLFSNKYNLKYHIEVVHERKFNCLTCGRNFASEKNLQYHDEYVHERKKQKIVFECPNPNCAPWSPCSSCSLSTPNCVDDPPRVKDGFKKYSCSECYKSFSVMDALKCHMKHIHSVTSREMPNFELQENLKKNQIKSTVNVEEKIKEKVKLLESLGQKTLESMPSKISEKS